MSRGTRAIINLNALCHNFFTLRSKVKARAILAMIKSNAYGHGLTAVAQALYEADALGVASLEEALQLRAANITQPIVVMAGFFEAAEIELFTQHRLMAVIHHRLQLEMLAKTKLIQPLSVWLKIDTGMRRLGFLPDEFIRAFEELQNHAMIQKPITCMTHLADADNKNHVFTQQQMAEFARLTNSIIAPKSLANSAGILAYPNSWADWVRPGIALYGVSPFMETTGKVHDLQPVMTLTAKLIAIKPVKKGDCVGYGIAWQCSKDGLLGIVGVGYGDGYPRHAANGTPTLIRNVVCPLIGRVSMDMIAVDLNHCPYAQVGDSVELWGENLPVEKIAASASTIAYELLCNVSDRVQRFNITNEHYEI